MIMWLIIVVIIAIAADVFFKNYSSDKSREEEAKLYTKEKLQQLSVNELHDYYMKLMRLVMSNPDAPDSKKIPADTKSYGCKTWGEARALMDLICNIHNSKLPKTAKSESIPQLTDAEKEKLGKMGELDATQMAYAKAKNGDISSMMFMGLVYTMKLNIPQKAFYWMDKATKAGNAQAEYFLGTYYADGYGVEKNTMKGISLIMSAASKGDQDAIDCCIHKLNMSEEDMKKCGISIA